MYRFRFVLPAERLVNRVIDTNIHTEFISCVFDVRGM